MAESKSLFEFLRRAAESQSVASVGQPDDALGARLVDEHADDLRRLADA